MSTRNETITVSDKSGFQYRIDITHSPNLGFSTAYYNGNVISQVELGRILEPLGDDDREWECYEDRFSEWSDEMKSIMQRTCAAHFTNQRD